MCLAIPGKILSIYGTNADVDFNGAKKQVSIALLKDVCVGDYVLVHAGFAIEKINEENAALTLDLISQIES